jgi:arylsulfatase A-like enzyme
MKIIHICFLIVFFFCVADGYSKLQAKQKPNILFILSDDHSAPFLGCYGNPDVKTPNIDKLAAEGVLFKHAYTTAPQCVPSRSSMLSCRNVLDVQMLRFSAPLDKGVVTFPELLREAGYYTGICGRTYHLDGSGNRPAETQQVFDEFSMETFKNRVDYLKTGGNRQVLAQFQEFLNQKPGDKPFFMWANYSDPHRIFDAKEFEPAPESIHLPARFPDTKLLREDFAGYLGEVNRLDTWVGQLVEELKKRGEFENTLIVFIGDNGGALLRGKGTLYDYGIHVPLIVRYPEVAKQGIVSNILVSGTDIGTTMLDIAGVKPDDKMTGKSFKKALKGDETENHEYLFAVRGAHGSALPGVSSAFDLSRVVFNQNFKLIYNPLFNLPYHPVDFAGGEMWKDLQKQYAENKLDQRFSKTAIFTSERPMFEFFDLQKDPDEFENLSGNDVYKEQEQKMKTALHRWMIIYRDCVPLPIPPGR